MKFKSNDVLAIRIEELVKETEKAVNVKLAVYKNHKDFSWNFWFPKSQVTVSKKFDEKINEEATFINIPNWLKKAKENEAFMTILHV